MTPGKYDITMIGFSPEQLGSCGEGMSLKLPVDLVRVIGHQATQDFYAEMEEYEEVRFCRLRSWGNTMK